MGIDTCEWCRLIKAIGIKQLQIRFRRPGEPFRSITNALHKLMQKYIGTAAVLFKKIYEHSLASVIDKRNRWKHLT